MHLISGFDFISDQRLPARRTTRGHEIHHQIYRLNGQVVLQADPERSVSETD